MYHRFASDTTINIVFISQSFVLSVVKNSLVVPCFDSPPGSALPDHAIEPSSRTSMNLGSEFLYIAIGNVRGASVD